MARPKQYGLTQLDMILICFITDFCEREKRSPSYREVLYEWKEYVTKNGLPLSDKMSMSALQKQVKRMRGCNIFPASGKLVLLSHAIYLRKAHLINIGNWKQFPKAAYLEDDRWAIIK